MRSTGPERAAAAVWEVVPPARASRVSGVSMAGFRDRGTPSAGQRAVPHPGVTIALECGAGPLVVTDGTGRERRGSLVAGLGFGPGAVWVRGGSFEAVQVRLSPVVAGAVLGVLWGREASRLRERLGDAASWEERFGLTEAVLARRRQVGASVDPEVAWAWRRIVVTRGMVRVDRLAAEVGWSRRRLWSRFQSQLGLPPKRAARLVRFDHAAHRLAAGDGVARVAAESGYADQSHLHRDVVAFTGVTPVALAREPWLAVDDIAWPGQGRRPEPAQVGGRPDPTACRGW
jgi:AraC-like DNA-binding protein